MLPLVFQGSVRSGFLAFFGQDRDRSGLQKFPFWEKTEPDWEKLFYIGPVLDICQLWTGWDRDRFKSLQNEPKNIKNDQDLTKLLKIYWIS